jgi:hypothetical protein
MLQFGIRDVACLALAVGLFFASFQPAELGLIQPILLSGCAAACGMILAKSVRRAIVGAAIGVILIWPPLLMIFAIVIRFTHHH